VLDAQKAQRARRPEGTASPAQTACGRSSKGSTARQVSATRQHRALAAGRLNFDAARPEGQPAAATRGASLGFLGGPNGFGEGI
jgi:hypothetical protein